VLFKNKLSDLTFVIIYFLISMIYQLTEYHLIIEFLNIIMKLINDKIINKINIPINMKLKL